MASFARARDPRLAGVRERYVQSATADGKGNSGHAAVKYWIYFCLIVRGISPVRTVDDSSPRAAKQEEEELLMDYAVYLVLCKPGGRSISAKTARKHVSTVQAWHRRQPHGGGSIGGGMELFRLHALLKGMRRELGDPAGLRRHGCRTQDLRAAMDQELSGGSRDAQMWRAALSVAFCALMRGGELGRQRGESFDGSIHLTRADVTFFRDATGVLHARLRMRPLKKERQVRCKGATVVLRAGGSLLDPVRELWRMLELDPVQEAARGHTPLFRRADGEAIATDDVCAMVKALMRSIGRDPARYGAHSLRIGGATAAMAAGVDPAIIKVLGRWSSDVYMIYMRCNREAAAAAGAAIASTPFHDTERGPQTEEFDDVLLPGQQRLPTEAEAAAAALSDSGSESGGD